MEELAKKTEVTVPKYINKISLNDDFIERNNLLSIDYKDNLGWLCGDYFYYALAEQIDADFYWLIEPDVGFTFNNVSDFFKLYENNTEDGLLVNFRKPNDGWPWTKTAERISLKAYQSFFPLSRLSKLGILACMAQRKRITPLFLTGEISLHLYPNDEALVASSLMKYQMSVTSLNSTCDCFRYFNLHSKVSQKSITLFPKNQIIHPIRSKDNARNIFLRKIKPAILQELEQYWIHNDDAKEFSEALQEVLYEMIYNGIMAKHFIKEFEPEINTILNEKTADFRKNFRLWAYNRNTLVVDYKHSNAAIALDIVYYDHNNICITIIIRQPNHKVYETIEQFYQQKITPQARLKICDTNTIEFKQKIAKIVSDFCLLCQEFEGI